MDVGELFVRVRPDTAGFKSESEAGVAGAGSALGKIFVAAFAAVGVADVIKHTVEAAVQQQATFAILNKTVQNAGAANDVHGTTVDNLVKQQAALKGFSVTDIAGAFTKLESVTRNSAEAFTLLNAAENLARGTGKDLSVSALGVEKAFEGSGTSLARYGIIIPKVTTAVDALREAHAKQVTEGVIFNAQQNEAYAVALRNATAQDKILTGQEAIAAIQSRFGGEAAAFAQTAAGEYDRLKVSVDQLAVTIGTALLPPLTTAITSIAGWADSLTKSSTVSHDASVAAHDFGVALHDVEDVARVVGPILGDVAKYTYDVVSAIGAPALLAAVGAFEGIKVAVAAAAIAQSAYNGVLAASAGVRTADTAITSANTGALVGNSAALGRESASLATLAGGYTAVNAEAEAFTALSTAQAADLTLLVGQLEAYTVALDEAATAEVALAGGEATFLGGLGALATGPAGLAIGVTALAGAVVYLNEKQQSWADINNAVTTSVQSLNAALAQEKNASAVAAGASAAAVQAAQEQLTTNIGKLTAATLFLGTTSGNTKAALDSWILSLDKQRASLALSDPVLAHNILLLENLGSSLGSLSQIPPIDIQLLINNQEAGASLAEILSGASQVESIIQELGQTLSTLGAPSSGAAASTDSARNSLSIQAIYAAQEAAAAVKADVTGGKTHTTLTEAARLAIEQLQQGIALATDQQQNLDQQMADAVTQGAIAVRQSVTQAESNFITIGQSIATDIGTYIDVPLTEAGNALQLQADRIAAIQQGLVTRFAGSNALLTQETNAISLRTVELTLRQRAASVELPGGHALSADPAVALRELQGLLKTATPAGAFALQQLIDSYQTDVIAVQRAKIAVVTQQPVAQAQQSADIALNQSHLRALNDRATLEKAAATNSINDWAAQWETKKITLEQFNTDVADLIKRDVGKLGNIAKIPGGQLLEQQLLGAITGEKLQALAIAQGPQIAGAAFLPTITSPLTALQNEQKQIASIAQSQRTTANTLLTDNRNILKLIYGATKDKTGLSSLAKNPPTGAQVHSALTGVGING